MYPASKEILWLFKIRYVKLLLLPSFSKAKLLRFLNWEIFAHIYIVLELERGYSSFIRVSELKKVSLDSSTSVN